MAVNWRVFMQRLEEFISWADEKDWLVAWATSLAVFSLAAAARFLFAPALEGLAFITFFPAIVVITFLWGQALGALFLVASAAVGTFYFVEPQGAFAWKNWPALFVFILGGGVNVALVGALREALRRAAAATEAKETMFRELQHRVANNLQLVVNLLRVAQRSLDKPGEAAEKLDRAEDRIMSMARLHRNLYSGAAFTDGLEPLLREVLSDVLRDVPASYSVIVKDAPALSVDQMTAIVFLVNEAAINAVKHVFAKGLGSRLEVSLTKDEAGRFRLSVNDDGPGMSLPARNGRSPQSLGIGIMEAFAMQLGGSLEIGHHSGGASVNVVF